MSAVNNPGVFTVITSKANFAQNAANAGAGAISNGQVFVQEQRIPQSVEWDDADGSAVHAVAFNRLGQAVATGRLLAPEPGVAKIGRMAVHRFLRGSGAGRAVLLALMQTARARGDSTVTLSAQRTAVGFFERLGFVADGAPFTEAGIPHQAMKSAL